MTQSMNAFFSSPAYAVVGVSGSGKKFGNAIYRSMKEHGLRVYPVNPRLESVEGDACFKSVLELPPEVRSVLTVVRPQQTELVVSDCARKGITAMWMQQGSQSPKAIADATAQGMTVVHGECILMFLEPVKSIHAFHRWFKRLLGKMPK
jgi:uncharacterized protein